MVDPVELLLLLWTVDYRQLCFRWRPCTGCCCKTRPCCLCWKVSFFSSWLNLDCWVLRSSGGLGLPTYVELLIWVPLSGPPWFWSLLVLLFLWLWIAFIARLATELYFLAFHFLAAYYRGYSTFTWLDWTLKYWIGSQVHTLCHSVVAYCTVLSTLA